MVSEDVKQTTAGIGFQVGVKIGKYEVREKLGMGGQAIVYKCYDPMLDRFVAIKQISAHLAEDPRFMERFRKEAQILARLGSEQPAIVTIYELIENEYGLFIVMEYVPGHSLETILNDTQGPIEPKATLQILWRLAAALHVVHQAGIIHRDIKPSNIIIAEGLRAKITDFGVAASSSGQTSMLLGTTKYMAPELFSGTVMDGRADMYSLGFATYEMLIGREKFNEIFSDVVRDRHSESLRWMKWHGSEQVTAPPAHEVNPAVSPALGAIVARMMAKDPAQRYENMEALGRAIKSAFSPRGKAAAAAAAGMSVPRAGGRGPAKPANVTALADRPGTAPPDEGDELEVAPESNPTAPLPKSRLSKRAKFILLGAIATASVVAITAFFVNRYIQEGNILRNAQGAFAEARARYKKGEFDEAKTRLETIARRFPNTLQSAMGEAVLKLCQIHLNVQGKKYEEALQTMQVLETLLKEYKRDENLAAFADDLKKKEVDKLKDVINDGWRYDSEVAAARKSIEEGKLQEAAARLLDIPRTMTLTPDREQELAALHANIKQIDVTGRLRGVVARALKAEEDKKYEDAQVALNDAEALMTGEDAKAVPAAELAKMKVDLQGCKNRIGKEGAYAAALIEVGNYRSAGKKAEEIAALKKAIAMRPNPQHSARIVELEMDLAYGKITDALDRKDEATAVELLKDFIAKYPDHPSAPRLLATLKDKSQYEAMLREADTAFDAKDYPKALEKYKVLANIRGDATILERIDRCKFVIAMKAYDDLRAQGQKEEARKKFLDLQKNSPSYAAEVQSRVTALDQEIKYADDIKKVKAEFALKHWATARQLLGKIQPLTAENKEEVKGLQDQAIFEEHLWLGKRELDMQHSKTALGYFNIARNRARTDEQIKEVADLIAQIPESER